MELIAKLGVDWKLLLAQIVNFGIVLTVLYVFVYRPLLRLLDDRRERIRKSLEDVDKIEKQKHELEEFRRGQLRKIDQECGALLERAKQDAQRSAQEVLALAKQESEEILRKGREQISQERARAFGELQGTLAKVIVRMTEKILEREFRSEDQHRLLVSLEKEIPKLLT
jgi:F-type H+-transporting ATPase subunit b